MSSSSRKQALPPLHVRTNSDASTVTSQDGSLHSYDNPVTSPTSGQVKDGSHSYEYEWPYSPKRKDSESSTSPLSPHHHHDNDNHNHASKKSPTVNRLTHCGRHTDQFLFGGHSISELIRSAINRDGGRNQ